MPKKYTDEFKADAIELYLSDPSATYKQVGVDLGVHPETLRVWVRDARKSQVTGRGGSSVTGPASALASRTVADEEIRKLRAENRRLREERDILRKAAGVFLRATD